jgi:hypothetical protein
MKTMKWVGVGLLILTIISGVGRAQTRQNLRPYSLLQNPALTNSATAVATIKQILATEPLPLAVPVVATTSFPAGGTYWTMQSPVPLPGDFFPDLPVYLLDQTDRTFLIDDRSVDYAALQAQQDAENATNGSGVRFPVNNQIIDTNELWLSVATNSLPGSNQFNVVIHETVTGNYYDVLTKTDLLLPTWVVEDTVPGATGNETPVTLEQNDRTNLFVWARESAIPIYAQPLAQEVASGDSVTFTVTAGGGGLFYQWTLNGTNIFGATGRSYTIQDVNAGNAGDYACIVSNANGTVVTQTATLTVDQGSGWPYDITTIGQRQDYTFRNGVTYNITEPIQLYGKTTIEAGAIIKFDYNYLYPTLIVMGTLQCTGTAYNPAVLTSVDDDTFGIGEQDSTGSPQPIFTGVPFLDLTFAGNVSLSDLRFRNADMAVGAPCDARLELWDSQFVQCYAGVVNNFGGTDGFHNVLFAGCFDAVGGSTNAYAIEMEQVTADVSNIWDSAILPSRVALTNSIVFGNIGSTTGYSAQNVTVEPDASNFQGNGTGNYYLAAASSLRQSGTTNISTRLLMELSKKTTTQPVMIPQLMNVSGNLTLFPQVARYSTGAPDRGYYYDALDYTVAYMTVFGTLTVEPGTAIGVRNEPIVGGSRYTWWGLDLRENSSVVSHAMPNKPSIFTDTQLVQEQDEYSSSSLIVPDFEGLASDNAPTMDFRFTKFYAPAGGFQVWGGDWEFIYYGDNLASYNSLVNWTMRDCELHGGRVSLGLPDPSIDLTQYYGAGAVDWENNLFEGVNINLNPATWWDNGVVNFDESLIARNNLFIGANWMALEPVPANAGNWTFSDNLFDGIDFQVDSAAPLDFDFNAYYPLPVSQELYNTMSSVLSLTAGDTTALASATNDLGGSHEVTLNCAPPYARGTFGNYYMATVTLLWQAGSQTAADAGLSQYTTFTNQAKDTASEPVDIGLHYVAATNSLPLDSDGDGVPDYVEAEHGTDLNNSMSDGVTNDLYNSAYDDVDLSGNGLVGRIKKALGQNPLDKNNPLVLQSVTTGEEPDIATFEVPIKYTALTNIGSLNLKINGIDGDVEDFYPAPDGNTFVSWDTDYGRGGQDYLQAQIVLNTPIGIDTAIISGDGIPAPFYASNSIQFSVGGSMFDTNGAYLDAQLPSQYSGQTVTYTIQLTDPTTTPPTVIKSITGSTTSAMIQEEWDGTCDGSGTAFSGDTVSAAFNAAFPDGTSDSRTNVMHPLASTEQGINFDGFDFTYMYMPQDSSLARDYDDYRGYPGYIWLAMLSPVDTLLSPQTDSGGSNDHYDSSFNLYDAEYWPEQVGDPGYLLNRYQITNCIDGLFHDMTNGSTKSFYCKAHGNNYQLSAYGQNTAAWIMATDLYFLLGNRWGTPHGTNSGIRIQYPYRFVFLDGCSTESVVWQHAFGIMPLSARSRLGPQAFVGWATTNVAWLAGSYNTNGTCNYDVSINYATAFSRNLANDFY